MTSYRYLLRRTHGPCVLCGKTATEGRAYCPSCRETNRIYQAARYKRDQALLKKLKAAAPLPVEVGLPAIISILCAKKIVGRLLPYFLWSVDYFWQAYPQLVNWLDPDLIEFKDPTPEDRQTVTNYLIAAGFPASVPACPDPDMTDFMDYFNRDLRFKSLEELSTYLRTIRAKYENR
jgi:hypothetical protein